MTISLTAPRLGEVSWRLVLRSSAVATLRDQEKSSRYTRLAVAGAVALSVVFPASDLARVAVLGHLAGNWFAALVATACYLPLYVQLVAHSVRGSLPVGAGWKLLAMSVVIIGAVPIVGVTWLSELHVLAVSVLILVPVPWSLAIFAGLAAAPIPLAVALGGPELGPYLAASVAWRSAAMLVMIWLIGAIRQLEGARLALTESAVTRERLRIDGELRRTIVVALEAIAGQAQRVNDVAPGPPAVVEGELRALVAGSRRTLAEARGMVGGYQRVSLRSELDTAATLLTAAGIETRIVLVGGDLPDTAEETLRSALRSATAGLLRDEATRSCVLTVVRRDGRVTLELRADHAGGHDRGVTVS